MSEEKVRMDGFEIFKNGLVRRLSPTLYVVKTLPTEGWHLVELANFHWICDCNSNEDFCAHLYATQLHRSTAKLPLEHLNERPLKCRYCGSLDVTGCGFRYGARGISKRYVCRECLRKFSVPYVAHPPEAKVLELNWLLSQIGLVTSRLADLLQEVNAKLESLVGVQSAIAEAHPKLTESG